MPRAVSDSAEEILRSASCRETDIAALRAIAQATVDVELFTIPLYMGALYSIVGMHQITGKDEDFYQNRWWPGPATTAHPEQVTHPFNTEGNARAFNVVFSVFIEEMLHLQMAANIATAIGVTPSFTSSALQDKNHGWTCYGPTKTIIPHIVDLADTETYSDVTVDITDLNPDQIRLFQAIEQPAESAWQDIKESERARYQEYEGLRVPFEGWEPGDALPLFGTIGRMYQCYHRYMNLRYDDEKKKRLWDYAFTPGSQQRDLFNVGKKTHPRREFCGFETTVTGIGLDPNNSDEAFARAVAMMNAITDQGEGSELPPEQLEALRTVMPVYQASYEALKVDYPRYTDTGEPVDSADAEARYQNGASDHYERFTQLGENLEMVTTWPTWHQTHRWEAKDLEPTPGPNKYKLPPAADIAAAMNKIHDETDSRYYKLISKTAVGAIAGITTVLNEYWNPQSGKKVSFPYPSMVGSGDRMAICWALFGEAPDLSQGVELPGNVCPVLHACQGLDFSNPGNNCAPVEVFHTCRGSNACKAQGGCGFVQNINHVTSCGFALVAAKIDHSEIGDSSPFSARVCGAVTDDDDLFSAPGDNKCGGFGGCAVPISASQIMPQCGKMELFRFVGEECESVSITKDFTWEKGEKVYDVAYRAYREVMASISQPVPVPEQPQPNDLRLVFPPST